MTDEGTYVAVSGSEGFPKHVAVYASVVAVRQVL